MCFFFYAVIGKLIVNEEERATGSSHDNEIAKPNYYKVKLDNGIITEMAPTERGAHLRFSFPEDGASYLVLDGYTGFSQIKVWPFADKGFINQKAVEQLLSKGLHLITGIRQNMKINWSPCNRNYCYKKEE